jgi:hypothetical protein
MVRLARKKPSGNGMSRTRMDSIEGSWIDRVWCRTIPRPLHADIRASAGLAPVLTRACRHVVTLMRGGADVRKHRAVRVRGARPQYFRRCAWWPARWNPDPAALRAYQDSSWRGLRPGRTPTTVPRAPQPVHPPPQE